MERLYVSRQLFVKRAVDGVIKFILVKFSKYFLFFRKGEHASPFHLVVNGAILCEQFYHRWNNAL